MTDASLVDGQFTLQVCGGQGGGRCGSCKGKAVPTGTSELQMFLLASHCTEHPPHPPLLPQDSALAFLWSRMLTVDEIKDYNKYTSLTFIDFLEALGRVADMKSLPLESELEAAGGEPAGGGDRGTGGTGQGGRGTGWVWGTGREWPDG